MDAHVERARIEAVSRGVLYRRNGYYERRILTVLGDTEVFVPRASAAS